MNSFRCIRNILSIIFVGCMILFMFYQIDSTLMIISAFSMIAMFVMNDEVKQLEDAF